MEKVLNVAVCGLGSRGKGHLEYLSRHSSVENDYMSHKLQNLLLELSEITENGNHYNKKHIIEQLDSIICDKNLFDIN